MRVGLFFLRHKGVEVFMTLTIDEALKNAVEAHQAGRIQEADGYYTAILRAQPRHPDANHNMGLLGVGAGRSVEALEFFKTAIEVNPSIQQFWISYINTLIDLNFRKEAQRALKKAKKKRINKEVLKRLEQRMHDNPDSFKDPPQEQLQELMALFNEGKSQQCTALASTLIQRFPLSAVLYVLQGTGYSDTKQFDEAIDCYKRALKINPRLADAHSNIGNALQEKGDIEGSLKSYQSALKIDADHFGAHGNMAFALQTNGDLEGAIASYRLALKANPNNEELLNNMGIAFAKKGDFDAAIKSYNAALNIKPDYPEVYNNMGLCLADQGQADAAIKSYQRALKIRPDFPEPYKGMASVFEATKDFEAAIENDKQALKFNPNYSAARSQKLSLQAHLCLWADFDREYDLVASLGLSREPVSCFAMLSLEDSAGRHRLRSELFAKSRFNSQPPAFNPKSIEKNERLRIAYFSADFREHPVASLIVRVLELHDRKNFEVYAYSYGVANNDVMRSRVVNAVDNFTDVHSLGDLDIAKLARKDNIDIAVDLTGYTQNSRSGIFAYRAAPIQINYLGFPGTMGVDFMDYIIADSTLIPDELRQHYSEKVIRLPHTYMATDNTREVAGTLISRAQMGLPENGFVFCVFNNAYKIKSREFTIWMRLLLQVEGSVLWLRRCHQKAEENLRREAEDRGVDSSRLIFAERVSSSEHLVRHKLADLFLDTFIFNAHSSAVDALWAGLPVVTKLGEGFAARVAGSLLTSLGMSELVVTTEEAYEALALDLATKPRRLKGIKQTLTENLLSAPLFDSAQFTKYLESGYRQAHERYIGGQAPADMQVSR